MEVPDSTDWLTTSVPGLAAVEAALRCEVCKDFYKTPMTTSCAHTFCSLCIRRALGGDGRCPLCRSADQELRLRSNWALEAVIDSFLQCRADMLAVARVRATLTDTPVHSSSQTLSPHDLLDTPSAPQALDATQSPDTQRSPKRRRVERNMRNASSSTPIEDGPEPKRLRSSARLSKTRSQEATAAVFQQELDVEEEADGVPCPICGQRMKEWKIFGHLDSCTGVSPVAQAKSPVRSPSHTRPRSPLPMPNIPPNSHPTSRPSPSSQSQPTNGFASVSRQPIRGPRPERLPALNYSMLKEAALRKKLGELGLSSTGPRALLERRHKEWITLWNANCDSLRPKRRNELFRDLDVWERTQGSGGGGGGGGTNFHSSNHHSTPGGNLFTAVHRTTGTTSSVWGTRDAETNIKDKDFNGTAWARKHEETYKELAASARKSRQAALAKTDSEDPPTDDGTADVGSIDRIDAESQVSAKADTTSNDRIASRPSQDLQATDLGSDIVPRKELFFASHGIDAGMAAPTASAARTADTHTQMDTPVDAEGDQNWGQHPDPKVKTDDVIEIPGTPEGDAL